jgi:hypothetical protein
MSRPDPPTSGQGADRDAPRPSWAGAPGYTPSPDLPAHAPMPGAPPYPALSVPAPQVTRPRSGPGFVRVLAAATVWAVVHVALLALNVNPVPTGRFATGLLVATLAAALLGWVLLRRRPWPFSAIVIAVAPLFWVLRAVIALLLG